MRQGRLSGASTQRPARIRMSDYAGNEDKNRICAPAYISKGPCEPEVQLASSHGGLARST